MQRRADVEPASRWDSVVPLAIVVATFGTAAAFLLDGAGYVLDDWYLLRNAHFDGAWAAAGEGPGAHRPASRLVFALVFGTFGQHPLPGVLLLAALNAATAVLTYHLLRRFVPRWQAGLVAVLWVVLPTHISTDLWLTCAIISVSHLALTAALHVALRADRRTVHLAVACALFALSSLSYEASMPMAAAAVVALPYLLRRTIDWPLVIATAITLGGCALWIVTHWFVGKSAQPWSDPSKLLNANFGWGITPGGTGRELASPLLAVALVGIAVALVRTAFPSFRATRDDHVILAGVIVVLLGFMPFTRYFYEPLGAGDRVNYLSAVGGALVWAGIAGLTSRIDRRVAVAGVGVLLLVGVAGRWERLRLWSAAGRDADAIAAAAVERIPDPSGGVVIGPAPIIKENVVAYFDSSNLRGALAIAYGVPTVDAAVSPSEEAWLTVDEDRRVDITEVSELDDTPLLGDG